MANAMQPTRVTNYSVALMDVDQYRPNRIIFTFIKDIFLYFSCRIC